MPFKYRDDFLLGAQESGQISEHDMFHVLEAQSKLRDPTRTVAGYTCDVSALLQAYGLQDEHGVFGGYGVLAQLVSRFGDVIIPLWRGSHDLDMFGSPKVLAAIKSGYVSDEGVQNHNIPNKKTYRITPLDQSEQECKVDFVLCNGCGKPYEAETIKVLGVPIRAVTPMNLIVSKIDPALTAERHLEDIESMLGVLEHRDVKPSRIAEQLEIPSARKLYGLLSAAELDWQGRFDMGSSETYVSEVKRELNRRANAAEMVSQYKEETAAKE